MADAGPRLPFFGSRMFILAGALLLLLAPVATLASSPGRVRHSVYTSMKIGVRRGTAASAPVKHDMAVEQGAPVKHEMAVGHEPVIAIRFEPAVLVMNGRRDERRALVWGQRTDGNWIDVTERAHWSLVGAPVRWGEDNLLAPARAGSGRVTATVDGVSGSLPIEVRSVASPPISFVREVMPVLSKAGCNAGTCHGSARGKDGFKLSLRGYDPAFDFRALTEDLAGRRVNRVAPRTSLILAKPTETVPHQGGLVFEQDSRLYRLLYRWIAEGIQYDVSTVKRANSLELLPGNLNMDLPGRKQQVLVIAHYPDGATRDVTRDAVFTSSVPDVATATPAGEVKAVHRGEAALLVRYEGNYATANILVMGDRSGFRWSNPPIYNFIDRLVYAKLKRVKVTPSDLCSDSEFIRRVSLDLSGIAPSPEMTLEFLTDPTPSRLKREKLVDKFLASSEFVDNWTNKWSDLLDCSQRYLGARGVNDFHGWIRNAVAKNEPYDQFVRDLVSSSGESDKNPAANFFRVTRDPTTTTEHVTQLFLGTRFSCNKCHDHPFERWTQQQYYQFGAFFAHVAVKSTKTDGVETVDRDPAGTVIYPRNNRPARAVFPFGPSPTVKADQPRLAMATWLTSRENPLFARAMANRVWSYFFGRGIIDPVDDIRSSNPASNPDLLDALTAEFVQSGFDVKHLMRTICTSRVYQLSLRTHQFNNDDTINFSHALPRRLTAEQLLDSIARATGSHALVAGAPDEHASQIADAKTGDSGSFLALFGSPPREGVCECERSSQVSLAQAMNLVNGPTLSDAINDPKGRIAALLAKNPDDKTLVSEIFLAALCRPPSAQELAHAEDYLKHSPSRSEGAQDLMWGLLTSPEFLFNH